MGGSSNKGMSSVTPQDYQQERLREVDGPPLGLLVLFVLSLILGLAVTALLPLLA